MSKLLRNGIPRKENGKIDWTPRRHHGATLIIIILGFLVPPLAVLVRFGVGKDFFINILMTIAGYIPGHLHNWFIQNVRNNDNKARTPKWAIRYGLVDDTPYKKKAKKRQWVGRYNDRNPHRTLYDDQGNPYTYRHDEDGLAAPERSRSTLSMSNSGLETPVPPLVDPDMYINAPQPSESPSFPTDASARSRSTRSRLPFRSKKDRHAVSASALGESDYIQPKENAHPFHEQGRTSFDSEGPEDPTRTHYDTRGAAARSSSSIPQATSAPRESAAPARARDPLEFDHEF